jgi:hypothetical protein
MARIARVVVPDLPHHITQGAVIGASRCFSRPTTIPSIGADRRGGTARRDSSLGLLPDAQSRPPANHAHLA